MLERDAARILTHTEDHNSRNEQIITNESNQLNELVALLTCRRRRRCCRRRRLRHFDSSCFLADSEKRGLDPTNLMPYCSIYNWIVLRYDVISPPLRPTNSLRTISVEWNQRLQTELCLNKINSILFINRKGVLLHRNAVWVCIFFAYNKQTVNCLVNSI